MGIDNSKNKNNNKIPSSLQKLLIYSCDLKLNKSMNYDQKIDELTNFIITRDYDVICIQGIHNKKCYTELQNFLHEYNLDNYEKLSYYPEMDISRKKYSDIKSNNKSPKKKSYEHSVSVEHDISFEHSVSAEMNNDYTTHDSIIISRYEILTMATVKIPNYICTSQNIYYIININFHNIIVSIFNISFQADCVGVTNHKIRKIQIKILHDHIVKNQDHLHSDFSEYKNKNMTFICIQSNINNFKNNAINGEYNFLLESLECIDTYDYVQKMKYGVDIEKKNNIYNIRSNYILLCLINNNVYQQQSNKFLSHFNNKSQGIGIRNSIIDINSRILNVLPFVTEFVLDIPSNEPFDNVTPNEDKTEEIE